MAFAQGSKTNFSYITETTYGTTPAGSFQQLPIITHNLDLTKTINESNEIFGDRNHRQERHGNRSVAGEISSKFYADVFDPLLESVLMGTWDTSPSTAPDELKVGSTLKSFAFEDYASDIDQSILYSGVAINSATFSIMPNQDVNVTWGAIGRTRTISQSQKGMTAVSTNKPCDSYSGSVTFGDSGGALGALAILNSVEFTIENGMQNAFIVGADPAPSLSYGMCNITGTIQVYYEDNDWIDRFADETETAFYVSVDDPTGANEYGFFFPRIKINGATVALETPNSRFINVPFKALYDTTEASPIVITRPETA